MKVYTLSLLPLLASCNAESSARVVDAGKNLTYLGTAQSGVESFLNIPFGEDVGGNKRFTRPVAKQVTAGSTIDARNPGPACPQQKVPIPGFPFFSNVTNMSENCLNLRVDRPSNASKEELLPVMVFIYGGGLSVGQVYDKIYTPGGLVSGAAAKQTPVIYVAMNYRLKIFGFAASDALSQEGNTNLGLLDQELALEWVQDNIRAFGGDPSKVTIFGESDGAFSVGLQITAHGGQRTRSLFQRAIMESGSAIADGGITSNASQVATSAVAEALKCPLSPSTATLECLRTVPFADLLNATLVHEKQTKPPFGFETFKAYVDGSFIPAAPSALIRSGRFAPNISTIIGYNLDDSSLFTDPAIQNQTEVAEDLAGEGLSERNVARTLALYPASEFTAANNASASYYRASRIGRDIEVGCPALFFSRALATKSPAVASNMFIFQLDQTPLTNFYKSINSSYYGVSHFSDVFYVFNDVSLFKNQIGATDADVGLGQRVSASWAAFATNGVPGSQQGRIANATLGRWNPAFSKDGKVNIYAIGGSQEGNVAINNATTHAGLDRLLERCKFLTEQDIYRQRGT